MNLRWALLIAPLMVIAFAQIVQAVNPSERTAAQTVPVAVAPYYTPTEAVGFVRGWMSEQRSLSPTNIGNCLAIFERARPTWSARWDGDHWSAEAVIPGNPNPRSYEFWERTWKVVNPNADC